MVTDVPESEAAAYRVERLADAEARAVAEAAGRLWAAGARIDWTAMRGAADRRRVPLPTYPFQRMRFDPPAPQTERGQDPSAPLRREDVRDFFHVPTWTRTVARAGSSTRRVAAPSITVIRPGPPRSTSRTGRTSTAGR